MTNNASGSASKSTNVVWHEGLITRSERWRRTGVSGLTVWMTGLSGSGKSTVAGGLERLLTHGGRPCCRLDGDNLRHGLNRDLGFSVEDRQENVRRVTEVARLMADAGLVALVPIISPFRAGRDAARSLHREADLPFLEIFVDTPLAVCEARDPKGLYLKARAGELSGMTGIDSPYEPPTAPDVRLQPSDGNAAAMAQRVMEAIAEFDQ